MDPDTEVPVTAESDIYTSSKTEAQANDDFENINANSLPSAPVDHPGEVKPIDKQEVTVAEADSSTIDNEIKHVHESDRKSTVTADEANLDQEPAKDSKKGFMLSTFFDSLKNCFPEQVRELVYWTNIQKSALTFTSIFTLLLGFSLYSFVSMLAYLGLGLLAATVSFRLYKVIVGAIQSKEEEHPFKEYLDAEVVLPEKRAHEVLDNILTVANCRLRRLRHLFLVENFVDSIKFGIVLYALTYVGALFNFLTVAMIVVVVMFTLPKIYEVHQEKIDSFLGKFLEAASAKAGEIVHTVKTKMDDKLPPKAKEFMHSIFPQSKIKSQ